MCSSTPHSLGSSPPAPTALSGFTRSCCVLPACPHPVPPTPWLWAMPGAPRAAGNGSPAPAHGLLGGGGSFVIKHFWVQTCVTLSCIAGSAWAGHGDRRPPQNLLGAAAPPTQHGALRPSLELLWGSLSLPVLALTPGTQQHLGHIRGCVHQRCRRAPDSLHPTAQPQTPSAGTRRAASPHGVPPHLTPSWGLPPTAVPAEEPPRAALCTLRSRSHRELIPCMSSALGPCQDGRSRRASAPCGAGETGREPPLPTLLGGGCLHGPRDPHSTRDCPREGPWAGAEPDARIPLWGCHRAPCRGLQPPRTRVWGEGRAPQPLQGDTPPPPNSLLPQPEAGKGGLGREQEQVEKGQIPVLSPKKAGTASPRT